MIRGSPRETDRQSGFDRLTPSRIAGIYLAFGIAMLVLSDVLLPAWVGDTELLRQLQAFKGVVEVLLTGALIYWLTAALADRLQRSERRYRNLVESAPAPITLFDEDGTLLWGNGAAADLLGVEEGADVAGRSVFEFVHPDDRQTAEAELATVVGEGAATGPTHMRIERGDGEVRHVRISTAPGEYDGHRVGQAVVVDVTDRREAEAELAAERDFVEAALDRLDDVFYVIDAEGRLKRWNSRLSAVTGYDDEELDGMRVTEFVDEDPRRLRESIRTAIETGTADLETDVVTKDGAEIRYEFKGTRLEDGGDVPRIVGIGRDVTERRRMERELRQNEQRYRTLVEMSPHPVLVHRDGEVVYANDAFAELVDAESEDDVLGEHINAFLDPDEHRDAEETAARTQRGVKAPTDNRRTVVTLAGRTRYIETTSRPIAYEDEPAVLTMVTDVTRRHRLEEMLTTLHERTREMTRAESRADIAEIAVEAAVDLLGVDGCLVYEFGGGDGLDALAWSGSDDEFETGAASVPASDNPVWEAFVDSEQRVVDDPDAIAGLPDPAPAGRERTAVAHPVNNHGVIVLLAPTETPLSTTERRMLNLVADNLDAAFDRAERERDLRDRDRKLTRQNEALAQMNRLNDLIREINATLVRSSSRSEMLATVCERLAAADQYAFAWIGTREAGDDRAVPEYWSGVDAEYIDHLAATADAAPLWDLVDAAFRECDVQIARDVLEDTDWAAHRSEVLTRGYRSVAAVPVARGDSVDGVLVIHAAEGDIFDDRERTVLAELGRTIGHALRNVDRAPGQSEARTEIELAIDGEGLFTNRITAALDARAEYVGAVRSEPDSVRVFLRLAGVSGDAVVERLEAFGAVEEAAAVSVDDSDGDGDGDGDGLYRLRISVPSLVRIAERNGLRIRSLTAEGGSSTLVAVLPGDVSVRSVVEAVQGAYPETELVARRGEADPVESHETYRDRILAALTDRQREALRVAFYSGFYEWPRETKSEDLADTLGIASSTYQYHLRAAERAVVGSVLGT